MKKFNWDAFCEEKAPMLVQCQTPEEVNDFAKQLENRGFQCIKQAIYSDYDWIFQKGQHEVYCELHHGAHAFTICFYNKAGTSRNPRTNREHFHWRHFMFR